MTAAASASTSGVRLAAGFQLGDYRLGAPIWSLRIADAYRADGPAGPATIYVVHPAIAAQPAVRDQIIAGTRAAAALPEHRHRVRTLAAGLTGDHLWIATEEVDGSPARDLLAKKRAQAAKGLGTRAAGNLLTGVAAALGDAIHGALADESVVVNRTGRVRVIDLALGPGTAAAMVAGLIPMASSLAPELQQGGPPSAVGDVYALGALLYEALVGQPLARGGPRPSDVVEGVNTQIDEVVARACHRDPDKRFSRADVVGEVVGEALTKGGAVRTVAVPLLASQPPLDSEAAQVSLATELGAPGAAASAGMSLDRVLAAALADSTEKWLISKGKLDYGPFSLADVVAQIETGEIVAGNLIMDKDTGARVDIGAHALLGPMVDAATQRRDDKRRAQAEVAVQRADKSRGVVLYGGIGLGVVGLVAAVYFIVQSMSAAEQDKIESVAALEGASLKVKVSEPKRPPPPPKRTGTGRRPSGGGQQGTESLALDMSDEGDEGGETLDMGKVYAVYSRYGGALGGCLQSTGASAANIYININGPRGRVEFARINGQTSGPLFGCLNRVLRGMKFPAINGPRTRAEFDIAL